MQWAIKKCNILNIHGRGEKSETTKIRNYNWMLKELLITMACYKFLVKRSFSKRRKKVFTTRIILSAKRVLEKKIFAIHKGYIRASCTHTKSPVDSAGVSSSSPLLSANRDCLPHST